MTQPTISTVRTHRLYSRLNEEEKELIRSAMDLCGYTNAGQFVREVLCGFSMRAITRYTTPKIVDEVLQTDHESLESNESI